MPVSRMRMRPWLEMKINSSTISGLVWVDKKEKIFSIPWKHAARHGWEVEKDACLFKEWAIHTGKFTEGQTAADPKTWKANFRCAMNSLPDIEEVKDKSVNKGHQAVRVYRMLKVTAKPKDRRSKAKDTRRRSKKIKEEEMECSDVESVADHLTQLHEDTPSPQENTVDSTEHQEAPYANTFDVPEWSTSIEIGPDSTSVLFPRFQVSPEHSPEYQDSMDDDIIQIAHQLELDLHWMQCGADSRGFLTNEIQSTDSYSTSSPGSQWSDTSSADELDLPLYTDLGSGLQDFWNTGY